MQVLLVKCEEQILEFSSSNTQMNLLVKDLLIKNSIQNQAANVAAQNIANQANLNRQQINADANVALQNQEFSKTKSSTTTRIYRCLAQAQGISGAYQKSRKSFIWRSFNQASNNGSMITAGLGH